MPFLHLFKKKSGNADIKTPPAPETATSISANTQEPAASQPRQESGQCKNELVADGLPLTPLNPFVDSEPESGSEGGAMEATSEIGAPPLVPHPHLSVAIGAFYSKLPSHLLAPRIPDMAQIVQIGEDDVVLDEATKEATLPLSILSLSCPEIFTRAIDRADDVPVTFYVGHPKSPEQPATPSDERPAETLTPSPPVENALLAGPGGSGEEQIKLRLQPILTDFPPQLEPAAIDSLYGTEAEIALPMGLVQAQLPHGRVVIPAEIFCHALPSDLKPYFESIDPAAEIPIPLQEIFLRLPPSAIKIREDQEGDHPDEPIPTPFTEQAAEDAKRFAHVPVAAAVAADDTPESQDEPPGIAVENNSKRLQAIFLTDESLDLSKTIQNVGDLPGLRSCLLSTTDGLKLAGTFSEPGQEKAILTLLPEVFGSMGSKLDVLQAGRLETITFYYDSHQLSIFGQGKLCLTVVHDNRPFKPGVREKIRAVLNELAALSTPQFK